jgi:5-methylcytosine-specific restriction endonuclease McrA
MEERKWMEDEELDCKSIQRQTHSLESRLKISASKRGKSNSMKGRVMPQHAKFGNSNPSWKGGVSKLSRRIRILAKYKEWRFNVFQKDNFTCQKCGKCVSYLHAHHQTVL